MTIGELLEMVRTSYLDFYKQGVEENRTEKYATEIMIQPNVEQDENLPQVFRIGRYDLITQDDKGETGVMEFNLDGDWITTLDPFSINVNGMNVEITTFLWNAWR